MLFPILEPEQAAMTNPEHGHSILFANRLGLTSQRGDGHRMPPLGLFLRQRGYESLGAAAHVRRVKNVKMKNAHNLL